MKDSFSIFIFDANRKLLMQQRSINKYPSSGLWSNTYSSQALENEPIEKAVHTKLEEELGFDCRLEKLSEFCYQVYSSNGGYEYEYNHVYIGFYNGMPKPNEDEIMSWKWMNVLELLDELRDHPDNYTYWFRQIYRDVLDKMSRKQKNRVLGL